MSESHRTVKKNFETQMWVDEQKLPLNHFVQETIANVMLGFSKTSRDWIQLQKKSKSKSKDYPSQRL